MSLLNFWIVVLLWGGFSWVSTGPILTNHHRPPIHQPHHNPHHSINTDGGRGLVVNFPGGGKYFYWQSGVATFLNRHFDLRHAKLVGASAVRFSGGCAAALGC